MGFRNTLMFSYSETHNPPIRSLMFKTNQIGWTTLLIAGTLSMSVAVAEEDPLETVEPMDLPAAALILEFAEKAELTEAQTATLEASLRSSAEQVIAAREAMAVAREQLREAQLAMYRSALEDLGDDLDKRQRRAIERVEKRLRDNDKLRDPLLTEAEREVQAERRREREAAREAEQEQEAADAESPE